MIDNTMIKALPDTLRCAAISGHLRARGVHGARSFKRHDRPPIDHDDEHAAAWFLGYYSALAEAGDEAATTKMLEAAEDLALLEPA